MSSNLAKQLAKLKLSEKTNDRSLKTNERPSILFSFTKAAEISENEIIEMTLTSLDDLIMSSPQFYIVKTLLDDLLNEESLRDRDMLLESQNNEVSKKIKQILLLISQNFLDQWALRIIETLLRVFQIHRHEADLLILLFLPFHTTAQYIRLLQNINLNNRHQWYFNMENLVKQGQTISRELLVSKFLRHYKTVLGDLLDLVFEVQLQLKKFAYHEVQNKGKFLIQGKKKEINEQEKEFILLRFWTVLTLEFFYYYSSVEFKLLVKTYFLKLCKYFFEKKVYCFKSSIYILTRVFLENNLFLQEELDSILLDFSDFFLSKLSEKQKKQEINQMQTLFILGCSKNWFKINSKNVMLALDLFEIEKLSKFKTNSLCTVFLRFLAFMQEEILTQTNVQSTKDTNLCVNYSKIIKFLTKIQEIIFNENNFHLITINYMEFFVGFFASFLFDVFILGVKNNISEESQDSIKNYENEICILCKKIRSNLQENASLLIEKFYQKFASLKQEKNCDQNIVNDFENFSNLIFGNFIQYGVVDVSDLALKSKTLEKHIHSEDPNERKIVWTKLLKSLKTNVSPEEKDPLKIKIKQSLLKETFSANLEIIVQIIQHLILEEINEETLSMLDLLSLQIINSKMFLEDSTKIILEKIFEPFETNENKIINKKFQNIQSLNLIILLLSTKNKSEALSNILENLVASEQNRVIDFCLLQNSSIFESIIKHLPMTKLSKNHNLIVDFFLLVMKKNVKKVESIDKILFTNLKSILNEKEDIFMTDILMKYILIYKYSDCAMPKIFYSKSIFSRFSKTLLIQYLKPLSSEAVLFYFQSINKNVGLSQLMTNQIDEILLLLNSTVLSLLGSVDDCSDPLILNYLSISKTLFSLIKKTKSKDKKLSSKLWIAKNCLIFINNHRFELTSKTSKNNNKQHIIIQELKAFFIKCQKKQANFDQIINNFLMNSIMQLDKLLKTIKIPSLENNSSFCKFFKGITILANYFQQDEVKNSIFETIGQIISDNLKKSEGQFISRIDSNFSYLKTISILMVQLSRYFLKTKNYTKYLKILNLACFLKLGNLFFDGIKDFLYDMQDFMRVSTLYILLNQEFLPNFISLKLELRDWYFLLILVLKSISNSNAESIVKSVLSQFVTSLKFIQLKSELGNKQNIYYLLSILVLIRKNFTISSKFLKNYLFNFRF